MGIGMEKVRQMKISHDCTADLYDQVVPIPGVSRFEVIDEGGRTHVYYNVTVETVIQDEGKTLKVFVKPAGANV